MALLSSYVRVGLLVLLVLLMIAVPLYLNHLEKTWLQRAFGTLLSTMPDSLKTKLFNLNEEVRKSVVRMALILNLAGIFSLFLFIAYRRRETARQCPTCHAAIRDDVSECPRCRQQIGNACGR
jgi:hypothetical protein